MQTNKPVFTPVFKEKDDDNQFFFQNNVWVKCTEETINLLWEVWVCSEKAHKEYEGDFTIFGYLNKES